MFEEQRKNWRRSYKGLLLLSYLIKNGSERVVTSAREHLYDLRGLETYTFIDEFGKDQGKNGGVNPYIFIFILTINIIFFASMIIMIGKKVEVSLRLFDIFKGNMVFIFL